MTREIILGLHFYQPPREAFHPTLKNISTDPEKKNWTAIIEKQCYEPLATEGILQEVSFDIYQSLLMQMEKLDPEVAAIYQKMMKENGVGEAFIHPILPDLSKTDKQIVISAGVKRFEDITGIRPKTFWPPETAIDTETLETLAENGYESFICAPEQIVIQDGSPSDNQPSIISLPSGREIIALPFDRPISSRLAFDPKKNADQFAESYIRPRNTGQINQPLIAWTDAETFGHHYPFADKFLYYLLKYSLPSLGLYPISINDLHYNRQQLPLGIINERSAWSCPHGNLARWNGSCGCSSGDSSWKTPFYQTFARLNNEISHLVNQQLGPGYPNLISDHFYDLYAHPENTHTPIQSLISSKISSLVARTSCATFFSHPEVSGKINLLYGLQSIIYLQEAGLSREASGLLVNFQNDLSQIRYPNSHETALDILNKMLRS